MDSFRQSIKCITCVHRSRMFIIVEGLIILLLWWIVQMLRKKFRPNYYYDIQRTKNEAYRHSWQVLHQVSDAAASALDILIPQPNSLNFTNINL